MGGLAVMLGNVEGKSVESFMPLDGGIVAEQNESRLFRIKEDHLPGDLGFDPLGLKPTNDKDLKNIATKELNNGRLAYRHRGHGRAGACVGDEDLNADDKRTCTH